MNLKFIFCWYLNSLYPSQRKSISILLYGLEELLLSVIFLVVGYQWFSMQLMKGKDIWHFHKFIFHYWRSYNQFQLLTFLLSNTYISIWQLSIPNKLQRLYGNHTLEEDMDYKESHIYLLLFIFYKEETQIQKMLFVLTIVLENLFYIFHQQNNLDLLYPIFYFLYFCRICESYAFSPIHEVFNPAHQR